MIRPRHLVQGKGVTTPPVKRFHGKLSVKGSGFLLTNPTYKLGGNPIPLCNSRLINFAGEPINIQLLVSLPRRPVLAEMPACQILHRPCPKSSACSDHHILPLSKLLFHLFRHRRQDLENSPSGLENESTHPQHTLESKQRCMFMLIPLKNTNRIKHLDSKNMFFPQQLFCGKQCIH